MIILKCLLFPFLALVLFGVASDLARIWQDREDERSGN